MVVAAGAGDRQAHEAPADNVDLIVDHVVRIAHEPGAQGEKAERCQRPPALLCREPIRRDLLDEKPVVSEVAVEGRDHVVAIGISPVEIGILEQDVALGIGIPRDVEPVSAPALAVMRRRQEPLDQAVVGIRGCIVIEGRDLLGRWRQAGQVEGRAADQGLLAGRWRRREAPGFKVGKDEAVDRSPRPGGILHRRRGPFCDGLKCPVLQSRCADFGGLSCPAPGLSWRAFRPGNAQLDPGGKVGDRLSGKLRLGWHLDLRVMADRNDQRALLGLARHHHRTGISPFEQPLPRVES